MLHPLLLLTSLIQYLRIVNVQFQQDGCHGLMNIGDVCIDPLYGDYCEGSKDVALGILADEGCMPMSSSGAGEVEIKVRPVGFWVWVFVGWR